MRHVHTRREHTLETTHLASGKRQARGEAHQAEERHTRQKRGTPGRRGGFRQEADHTLGFRQEAGETRSHAQRPHTRLQARGRQANTDSRKSESVRGREVIQKAIFPVTPLFAYFLIHRFTKIGVSAKEGSDPKPTHVDAQKQSFR